MKYMGHKGRIVTAIRQQIAQIANDSRALCDAFCGSAVVAWDLAEQFEKPVLAGDLQSFATARANAVLSRTEPIHDLEFTTLWFKRAEKLLSALSAEKMPPIISKTISTTAAREIILRNRNYSQRAALKFSELTNTRWPITFAYGGYFFSVEQAIQLDALRATLPKNSSHKAVALAALIGCASKCAAAPGHTAQPLGLKKTSIPHIADAWLRSIPLNVEKEVKEISLRHAKIQGEARVSSWDSLFDCLSPGDLVFCDPPYSDVHYSRFYHVLETLCRGKHVEVSGSGRNPPMSERPSSEFSKRSQAKLEANKLIRSAAERELRLVITFPVSKQSNGLMAYSFVRTARQYFSTVIDEEVTSLFSSLGGNGKEGARPAREPRVEKIICCY